MEPNIPKLGKAKYRSIITIEDDGQNLSVTLSHNPPPEGPAKDWHYPAQISTTMCETMLKQAKEGGIQPVYEARRDAVTDHISITTRQNKPKE